MARKPARRPADDFVKSVADRAEETSRRKRGEKPPRRKASEVAIEKAKARRARDPKFTVDDGEWAPPTHSKSGRELKRAERDRYASPDVVPMRTLTTEGKKQVILAGLMEGLSITGACNKAGTCRRSFYDWQAADEVFAANIEDAIEQGTDSVEDLMLEDARKPGAFLPKIAVLKSRRRAKWGDGVKADLTVNVGMPVPEFDTKFVAFAARISEAFTAHVAAKPATPMIEAVAVDIGETAKAFAAATTKGVKPTPQPAPAVVEVDDDRPAFTPAQHARRRREAADLIESGVLPIELCPEDLKP